ncbi:type III secretion protein [Pseudomonas marginalis]|nr:type III secretion protein [Pseudomonas marginalis]
MSIGSIGSSGSSPFGSGAGGMSAEQADAGIEAAEAKKRADGVKNAWKTAENQNTTGIKAASDALRL